MLKSSRDVARNLGRHIDFLRRSAPVRRRDARLQRHESEQWPDTPSATGLHSSWCEKRDLFPSAPSVGSGRANKRERSDSGNQNPESCPSVDRDLGLPCVLHVFYRHGLPIATAFALLVSSRGGLTCLPTPCAQQIYQYLADTGTGLFHMNVVSEGDDGLGEFTQVRDPAKIINVYGYAYCGILGPVMAGVCEGVDLGPARTLSLPGWQHVAAETFYSGDWHYLDLDVRAIFRQPAARWRRRRCPPKTLRCGRKRTAVLPQRPARIDAGRLPVDRRTVLSRLPPIRPHDGLRCETWRTIHTVVASSRRPLAPSATIQLDPFRAADFWKLLRGAPNQTIGTSRYTTMVTVASSTNPNWKPIPRLRSGILRLPKCRDRRRWRRSGQQRSGICHLRSADRLT